MRTADSDTDTVSAEPVAAQWERCQAPRRMPGTGPARSRGHGRWGQAVTVTATDSSDHSDPVHRHRCGGFRYYPQDGDTGVR
jgi:hypothetical protein